MVREEARVILFWARWRGGAIRGKIKRGGTIIVGAPAIIQVYIRTTTFHGSQKRDAFYAERARTRCARFYPVFFGATSNARVDTACYSIPQGHAFPNVRHGMASTQKLAKR